LVAAWPALALLLVVEMLSSKGKLIREMGPSMTANVAVPDTVAELEQEAEGSSTPVSPAPAGARDRIPERTERRHRRGK
jgi:hypothetical protein